MTITLRNSNASAGFLPANVVLLTGVLCLAVLAVSAQAVILDTFTRGDHYDPVATEVGMSGTSSDIFQYGKGTLGGGSEGFSSGAISGGKLYMNRRKSAGHQVILLDSEFPDLTMSTTINWDFDQSFGPYESVVDAHGFWLRKPAATSAQNNVNNSGGVSVFTFAPLQVRPSIEIALNRRNLNFLILSGLPHAQPSLLAHFQER